MLLPPDLRSWVPENHIVHFLIEAVDRLPNGSYRYNHRGSGSAQYPPEMMLTLLIYSYIAGRFSSRLIEESTHSDVIARYICGGDLHPDHDTLCTFRRENRNLFTQAFTEVLVMAAQIGGLKKVGTVSVDGTKIKANASRHAAVSYGRAAQQMEMLRGEVEKLTAKAEAADSTPLEDGLSLPEEIARRETRIAKLDEARGAIEERYREEQLAEKRAAYEEKKRKREEERKQGRKPKGKEPKPPREEPPDSSQINFTDPESRIMKTRTGYEQCYNAQAGVDADTMLIVEGYVTEHPNDKREIETHLKALKDAGHEPDHALFDSGYYSEEQVAKAEETEGAPVVHVAVGRHRHGLRVEDLERRSDPPAPGEAAGTKERMAHRLQTREGRERYKLRKQTVEPVFGIIKEAMGFRQMSMRGKEKAETEWTLVCLSYNLKRLFNLQAALCPETPAMT
jgi:transposase